MLIFRGKAKASWVRTKLRELRNLAAKRRRKPLGAQAMYLAGSRPVGPLGLVHLEDV